MVKKVLFVLLLFGILGSLSAVAQTTRTAVSCAVSDVQTQVNAAANGDTVQIPACPQTNWSTALTVSKCITIRGAGQGATTIGDNVTKNGTDTSVAILLNPSCSTGKVDLSGFTLVGVAPDSSLFNKGHVRLLGSSQSFRIHHITITSPTTSFLTINTSAAGLIDHLVDNCAPSAFGSINMKNSGSSGYGDAAWAAPDSSYPGSANSIYIEDNTFTCGSSAITTNLVDGDSGASFVFRFNSVSNGNTTSHGTDSSQRERSIRWQESYKNTADYNVCNVNGCSPDFFSWIRGGSGIVWGNTITTPWINSIAKGTNLRDTGSYTPWGQCNGSSVYDQDSGATGYRCVDQPGAGQSNNLSGQSTPASQWVGNSSFPFYAFNNTSNGGAFNSIAGSTNVVANRDFYAFASGFNGTSGVGSGTLAARPSTCTAGVAYWATDQGNWNKSGSGGQGVLYKCTATNTWSAYYTPYTYPHPLQSGTGGGGTGSVNAPSALQAVAH